MDIWVPSKPVENPKQNTVIWSSCCGCSKCALMGQCRELGAFFNFFALISSCPFTLWFQFCRDYTQVVLSVSPSRQTWDGCPFLALIVLDLKICSNTVWTKCSDSYFGYNYNRDFNIIVVIFVCFLKKSILFTLSCFITGTESLFVTTVWLQW